MGNHFRIGNATGELDIVTQMERIAHLFHSVELRPASNQNKSNVVSLHSVDDMVDRSKENVDALRLAHDSYITNQVLSAAPVCRFLPNRGKPTQIGAASDDEHVLRIRVTSRDGDLFVGVVRRDHNVSGSERQAFGSSQRVVEHASTTVFRLVHLWIQIMLIVQHASAAKHLHPDRYQK